MKTFKKPPLSIEQQVDQWEKRGLIIPDRDRIIRYLNVISYYRLSGYTLPFQIPAATNHNFKKNIKFDDILDLYIFDRQLRLLVMDAIERIEVGLRSVLNNFMAVKYGSHWYMESKHFMQRYRHNDLLEDMKELLKRKRKEVFIQHYIDTYCEPKLPPGWMMIEIISFGQLSWMYENLSKAEDRKAIARFFNTPDIVFISWMKSLNYLRNLCAHHSRLWNREMAITPKTFKRVPESWIQLPIKVADPKIKPEKRIYMLLVIIRHLLKSVNKSSSWHNRLISLFNEHSNISKPHMGIPEKWLDDPFWDG